MNVETLSNINSTDGFLYTLQPFLGTSNDTHLEYSWVLRPGSVQKEGRLSTWLQGGTTADSSTVANALSRLNAPPQVRQAQASCVQPYIQGIGISATDEEAQYRLYLHSRHPLTKKAIYEAWRWEADKPVQKSGYQFQYASSAAAGPMPENLIPPLLLPAFRQMVAVPRFRQLSGYWLRTGEAGRIEQVDLCFPWLPAAGAVPGFATLLRAMDLPQDDPELLHFPVRHIAFKTSPGPASVTLYTAAPAHGLWPAGEAALQQQVATAATASGHRMEQRYFTGLPALPAQDEVDNAIGRFYDGPLATWRQILGKRMHYHHGLFAPEDAATDDAMEAALDKAVTTLYPLLPANGRIYDVGCGWGGPMSMIVKDTGCSVLGITPSKVQYRYLSALGYDVRLGNAEHTLPPGYFEAVLMLESLCHVADKERLLTVLRRFSGRLVLRVNCQDAAPASTAFGGSMHMVSTTDLRQLLEQTGWKIQHWQNVRPQAMLSAAVWHRRQQPLPLTDDTHLEALRLWTTRVLHHPTAWGHNNPLIEVMAE